MVAVWHCLRVCAVRKCGGGGVCYLPASCLPQTEAPPLAKNVEDVHTTVGAARRLTAFSPPPALTFRQHGQDGGGLPLAGGRQQSACDMWC